MKQFISVLLAVILIPATTGAQVIVNDSWADGGRNNGTDPVDADWWTSSSSAGIEVSTGSLGLVTGTGGRGIHGTFTPQTLAIGDTLTATFTFTTPATVGSAGTSAFRVGLMDFNNAGLAADLTASSSSPQPLYIGLPGYMLDFDVNTGSTADTSFRKHNEAATDGRLLGTTVEWSGSANGPDDGYSFLPNTEYVGVFSVTRTGADTLDLSGSLSQGASLLTSYTVTDNGGIANHFGLLAFHVTANQMGSSGTPDTADNGVDFSNIKIEYFPAIVPEPSSVVLLLGGLLAVGVSFRRETKAKV